jgi:PIN domain nuclease of toxin-antitoxin system
VNLLLDTHIWIWSQLEPERVSSDVKRAMADPENILWLSPVSIWELIVHVEKKRIILQEDVFAWIESARKELLLQEAPLSWAITQEMVLLPIRHRDPADRFLVATAKVLELTLVTADRRMLDVEGIVVLPNR